MGLPAKIENVSTLRDILAQNSRALAQALPKHLTVEKLIRLACDAASRQPLLFKCTTVSILRALMASAKIGLEPNGPPLNHGHLVPFFNSKLREHEAVFMPGYQGLILLATQSGRIESVEGVVVYERDHFSVHRGTDPKIVHDPVTSDDPGEVIAAYATAWPVAGGRPRFEVMSRQDLEKVRRSSRSGDKGPWVEWYSEMCKKTVIKRLTKQLPLSTEDRFARAVEYDSRIESGESLAGVLDLPTDISVEEAPKSKTADLREHLQRKADAAGPIDEDEARAIREAEKAEQEDGGGAA